MGYIFVESEFDKLIDALKGYISDLDNYEDQEYCRIIDSVLNTIEELELSCDTTDALKNEMTEDFKRVLEGYNWD